MVDRVVPEMEKWVPEQVELGLSLLYYYLMIFEGFAFFYSEDSTKNLAKKNPYSTYVPLTHFCSALPKPESQDLGTQSVTKTQHPIISLLLYCIIHVNANIT